MKRRIFRFVICLFFSFITMFVVAWFGHQAQQNSLDSDLEVTEADYELWNARSGKGWPDAPTFRGKSTSWGGEYEVIGGQTDFPNENEKVKSWFRIYIKQNRAGWPFWCFYSEYIQSMGKNFPPDLEVKGSLKSTGDANLRHLQILKGLGFNKLVVPYAPIYTGIVLNIVFYGSIWLFLLWIPGFMIQRSRKHRGRCPECSYDLRKDLQSGCPECGWGRGK